MFKKKFFHHIITFLNKVFTENTQTFLNTATICHTDKQNYGKSPKIACPLSQMRKIADIGIFVHMR